MVYFKSAIYPSNAFYDTFSTQKNPLKCCCLGNHLKVLEGHILPPGKKPVVGPQEAPVAAATFPFAANEIEKKIDQGRLKCDDFNVAHFDCSILQSSNCYFCCNNSENQEELQCYNRTECCGGASFERYRSGAFRLCHLHKFAIAFR